MAKIPLKEHRQMLEKNLKVYTQDFDSDRLIKTMIPHIRKDFNKVRFNVSKKQILKKIILLIFETQDNRPFFHVEGTELPLCWNTPDDWKYNYIRYEWGHLPSKNQNPESKNVIENVGLYSARCNQHIQAGMDIKELMIYGGILAQRISNVLTNRRKLFDTPQWKELIKELRS